jgi:hypothetical protein
MDGGARNFSSERATDIFVSVMTMGGRENKWRLSETTLRWKEEIEDVGRLRRRACQLIEILAKTAELIV